MHTCVHVHAHFCCPLNPAHPPLVTALFCRRVVWVSASQPGPTLGLRYQQIVMHAISREGTRPCLYLQLDNGSEEMQDDYRGPGGGAGEEEEDEGDEVATGLEPEVRFIPEDASKSE
jgi:hypothetical protein